MNTNSRIMETYVPCYNCKGVGFKQYTDPYGRTETITCIECTGRGYYINARAFCTWCNSMGRKYDNGKSVTCSFCQGKGFTEWRK